MKRKSLLLLVLGAILFYGMYVIYNHSPQGCKTGWKSWVNHTQGFSLCMPSDWTGVGNFGPGPVELYDDVEGIGKYALDAVHEPPENAVLISYSRKGLFHQGWCSMNDSYIVDIKDNRVIADNFNRLKGNQLSYRGTSMLLKSGKQVTCFHYQNNDAEHVQIISSIKALR